MLFFVVINCSKYYDYLECFNHNNIIKLQYIIHILIVVIIMIMVNYIVITMDN